MDIYPPKHFDVIGVSKFVLLRKIIGEIIPNGRANFTREGMWPATAIYLGGCLMVTLTTWDSDLCRKWMLRL